MSRVFANGSRDTWSIPDRFIQKIKKLILDTSLLNTQHYKIRIKGKVEQSREMSKALPYTSKGAFGSPSTTVAIFTFLLL